MRKICIATGTRADWGLLSGIARALNERDDCEVKVIATNMHLSRKYGHTIDEIIADGFTPAAVVDMDIDRADGSRAATAGMMARCMEGMAGAIEKLHPDLMVILGDRFEMLATASAALVMNVPIVHIAGGEISEGAVDDSIRHAITKMAALHLTATEPYRRRVIAMGEEPQRVVNAGAIGVYNIMHEPLMSRAELEQSIGFALPPGSMLVTYHPATLDDENPALRVTSLLDALDCFPDSHVIITYPNNDARGRVIIDLIEDYGRRNPERVKVIPSLGKLRYLSALKCVDAVVGNSSSGIVEVPSMGIPTVDIGIRQRGRLASESVIHCGDTTDEITAAIALALSPEGQQRARISPNPYYQPDTLDVITRVIATTPLETLHSKKFHDV